MYKRILLKLSGESLQGNLSGGICEDRLAEYAEQIIEVAKMGIQVGIVIGGGNIKEVRPYIESGRDREGLCRV